MSKKPKNLHYGKYYGKKKEENLKNTEYEYFRDDATESFKRNTLTTNHRYEHHIEVKNTEENANDYYYEKQIKLRKLRKLIQENNYIVTALLRKRDLNKIERLKYDELKEKLLHNVGLTYDEDMELDALKNIRFVSEDEKRSRKTIEGIDALFYYKNAYTKLKQKRVIEWNNKKTVSQEPTWNSTMLHETPSAKIIVVKEDAIDHTCKLQKRKLNPVIVSTVSHLNPGGSWERGEEGAEESLFYRSSYYLSLSSDDNRRDGFYPLVEEATLYSPKVMLYRQGKSQNYNSVNTQRGNSIPTFISVLACSGLRIEEENKAYKKYNGVINRNILSNEYTEIYKNKVRNVLQTALYWGHRSLIFDAFGCINTLSDSLQEYNKNKNDKEKPLIPVKHCVSLIRDVIFNEKDAYYKKFKQISFCIDVKTMTGVPKPKSVNDPYKFIYEKEAQEAAITENVYRIFHQTLHDVDKYSN